VPIRKNPRREDDDGKLDHPECQTITHKIIDPKKSES